MWQQARLAETELAQSAGASATPTPGGVSFDPIFPLSSSSSSVAAGASQSQVSVAGENGMVRDEAEDDNLKRQIELKREEQASLKTEIEQLFAGLETSDKRQILRAQNLYNEGLVVMRNILRERIGVTGPDVEAAPAREPFQQDT